MTLNFPLHRSTLTFVCAFEHSLGAWRWNAVLLSTKRWNSDREKPRNKRSAYARELFMLQHNIWQPRRACFQFSHFISILLLIKVCHQPRSLPKVIFLPLFARRKFPRDCHANRSSPITIVAIINSRGFRFYWKASIGPWQVARAEFT